VRPGGRTPPKRGTGEADRLAWLRAVRFLTHPYLLILFIVTFIDATIHNGYFVLTGEFLGKIGIQPPSSSPRSTSSSTWASPRTFGRALRGQIGPLVVTYQSQQRAARGPSPARPERSEGGAQRLDGPRAAWLTPLPFDHPIAG
jgi:hypothetical protein